MSEGGGKYALALKSLVAGGVAGMAGKTVVAPLDRVKILLQTQKTEFTHCGITSALINILKAEGVSGLFRGNMVQMIRIFPYGGIQFSIYEVLKKFLSKDDPMHCSHMTRFLAGSIGGVSGMVATYPLDTLRANLAFHSKNDAGYKSLSKASLTIYKKKGLIGFYRGLTPSIMAIVPQSGLSFCFFEQIKIILIWNLHILRVKDNKSHEEDHYQLTTPGRLVAGGLAGALAQSVCYPLDVIRRRMQLGDGTKLLLLLKDTYYNHGIRRGWYRGMSVNFVRSVPLNAVSFCVYESCKHIFGISTSVKDKKKL